MTAEPLPRVVIARKIGVGATHRLFHCGRALGHSDEVNVVRHQAVSPNGQTLPLAVVAEQVQVEAVVPVLKERLVGVRYRAGYRDRERLLKQCARCVTVTLHTVHRLSNQANSG